MKKTIIFIHGWSSDKRYLDVVKDFCIENDYDYYSFDLPLHGEFKNENYDKEITFEDIEEFTIKKINDLKLNNVTLVGHSMGGGIILLDYNRINNLSHIILINPLNANQGINGLDELKSLIENDNRTSLFNKKIEINFKNVRSLIKLILSFRENEFKNRFNEIYFDENKNIKWSLIYGVNDTVINGIKTAKWLKKNINKIDIYPINSGHNPYSNNQEEFIDVFKKCLK